MAALIKRGNAWNVKYRNEHGRQIWVKGYSDKSATRDLARKLEDRARAVRLGHVDPIVEQEQAQRVRPAAELIDAYDTHLAAAGRSSNHISYTIGDIRKCFEHAEVTMVGKLTKEHVDAWVLSLAADAPRTINRRVGSVQAFLRYCHEHGAVSKYILNRYPKRNVKGTEKRKCRHLTDAEAAKLLGHVASRDRRDVYRFALLTGFRFSEIASMTPASFDLTRHVVTVQASDAKNKKRHQTIPLHPELHKLVQARCKGKSFDDAIFTMPPDNEAAKLLRADAEAAGIDPGRLMFHSLRHTFITRLAENMVHPKITQTLARHSSIETTMGYYTHFRQADERSAVAMLKG